MTATTDEQIELHPCACGCGELVPKKWARGHWARGEAQKRGLRPLPGPDDEIPEDDEELPDELVAELDALDWIDEPITVIPGYRPRQDEPPADDPPAGKIPPPRTRQPTSGTRRPQRVTATIQKDVKSKIRMITYPAAQMWAMRDEICGPVAVKQEPEIADAFAEIVCDSPDLLNFFTGVGGGYMKYFKLFMACLPVGTVVIGHHIAHREEGPRVDGQQPPQMANYAA